MTKVEQQKKAGMWSAIYWGGVMDMTLFALFLEFSLFIATHGKSVASHFFFRDPLFLMDGFASIEALVLIPIIAIALTCCRHRGLRGRPRVAVMGAIVLVSTAAFQMVSSDASTLVFVAQGYVLVMAALVVALEEYVLGRYPPIFFKGLANGILRLLKQALILYGAGITLLQWISGGIKEDKSSFLTSLFYPSYVVLLTFVSVSYWVLLPAWQQLASAYAEGRDLNSLGSPIDSEESFEIGGVGHS